MGAFCAVIGALMLVAPHQFAQPAYAPLQPALGAWGGLFLLSGMALCGSTVLAPPRGLTVAIHLLVCTLLLVLATGFAAAGSWTGTINYTLLGLGVAVVALLPPSERLEAPATGHDLLVMVLGASAVLSGLMVVALPGEMSNAVYYRARPALGLALLAGGLAVLLFQWLESRAGAPQWVKLAGHLLAAASYLVFLAGAVLPAQAWVPILYYGGFALFLAALPLVEPLLTRLVPTMLRVRVAMLLISVASVPIIVTVALMGSQEERSMRLEALDRQAQLAQALAQSLAQYIGLHQAALTALADQPGLLEWPPAEQTALLEIFNRAYPEVSAFSLYGADGRRLAVSEGMTFGSSLATQPLFEDVRRTGRPSLGVVARPGMPRPLFGFAVPVFDAAGRFGGVVTLGLHAERMAHMLQSENAGVGGLVSLVNAMGQPMLGGAGASLDNAQPVGPPAVAQALTAPGAHGSFGYALAGDEELVGYARVPGLAWLVLVERPASSALAGVRSGRDLAFGVLLAVLLLTGLMGVLLAGWVTAPLKSLAHLARELAAGRSQAPLPHSDINEVAQLAEAFGEMRAKLAARTYEHEQSQAELQRSEAELRQLSARIQETQEQERARIAREVHDELGGALTGLKMDSAYLARHWGGGNPGLREKTEVMAQLIDEMVQTVRRIATELRPAILDDFGLLAAIEWQLQTFGERTGIECDLACGLEALDLDHDRAMAVFRVFQETLTNVARHAKATRVAVQVRREDGCLVLRVADNGLGLRAGALSGTRSLGLVGMRERVQQVGGSIEFLSEPGQGTTVNVRVPLPAG